MSHAELIKKAEERLQTIQTAIGSAKMAGSSWGQCAALLQAEATLLLVLATVTK